MSPLLSLILAQLLGIVIFELLPPIFSASTDIVGFPIHANFNINRYYQLYFIEAVLVPLLWLFFYQLKRTHPDQVKSPLPPPLAVPKMASSLPQTVLNGIYWLVPLSLFLLPLASFQTRAVEPNGVSTAFPWLSWKLFFVFLCGTYTVFYLRYRGNDKKAPLTQSFLFLVAPLLLFLLHSHLPQPRTWIHLYHDGESLVPSLLLQRGLMPWRDFLYTHGLLQDPLLSWVGHKLFENSIWGSDAGAAVILAPLYWVAWYFFCLSVFNKKWGLLFLYSFVLPILYPLFFDRFNFRFLFFPGVLLLLHTYLKRRGMAIGLLLGSALAILLFLTPELLPYLICCLVVLAASAWVERLPHRDLVPKAVLLGLCGSLILLALFLHRHQALFPFIQVYADEGLHYRFESGVPMPFHLGTWFTVALMIPWIAYFWGTAHFFQKLTHREMSAVDWVMLSYHGFSILYFAKFLCRPDTHILAHTALALPILGYFISRMTIFSNRITNVACLALLLITLPHWRSEMSQRKFNIAVPERSQWQGFGYRPKNDVADEILTDLSQLFNTVLSPGDTLFDFTNEPALFHYLLGRKPAARYPYIIVAATEKSQNKLIEDLKKTRPKLVIYSSQLDYASWDGVPGMVRHYKVSQYLLDNYKPFVVFKHHAIFQRSDLSLSYQTANLLPLESSYRGETCDWGYAPNFLKTRLPPQQQPVAFRTKKAPSGFITELEVGASNLQHHSHLEIKFSHSEKDAFSVVDAFQSPSNKTGMVLFKTLSRENYLYSIPVGSCPQWHLFRGNRIFISHRKEHQIASITLRQGTAEPRSGLSLNEPSSHLPIWRLALKPSR